MAKDKEVVKVENVVEEVASDAVAPASPVVEGEEVIDESKYAFAMAPVVRLMKEELDDDKMIRGRVKVRMNEWLEQMCRNVTKQMNRSEYTMVEEADFNTAIEPYEKIADVEGERHRIVATLEKIKQDCDSLIRDTNRKFITPTVTEYKGDSQMNKE